MAGDSQPQTPNFSGSEVKGDEVALRREWFAERLATQDPDIPEEIRSRMASLMAMIDVSVEKDTSIDQ